MATITIPANLLKFTNQNSQVAVNGSVLSECLNQLFSNHADLQPKILTGKGTIQRYIKIFIDGDDSTFCGGLAAKVLPNSQIKILTALAGG